MNEIEWEVDKSKTLFQNLQAVSIIFQLMQQSLFCGHIVTLIHVYGQYQCPICKTKALPCYNGDNYDTNLLLRNELTAGQKLNSFKKVQVSQNNRDETSDTTRVQ